MLVRTFRRLLADQTGATAIEYGLLAGMMAVACIASFTMFGDALVNLFAEGAGGPSDVMANQIARLNR